MFILCFIFYFYFNLLYSLADKMRRKRKLLEMDFSDSTYLFKRQGRATVIISQLYVGHSLFITTLRNIFNEHVPCFVAQKININEFTKL